MAEAGWYDDPLIPGRKRYWDGAQWTDHAQAPPAGAPAGAGFAAQGGGPPPFIAAEAAGGPPGFSYSTDQVNDLGEWLGRSFKMTFQQVGPLAIFTLLPIIAFAISYYLLHLALTDAFITRNGFFDFNYGLGFAAAAMFAVTVLVGVATTLAGHHNLFGAHVGQPPGWGQSLAVGFGRLLRYLGINLLLMLAFYVVIGVVGGLIIGLSFIVGDSTGIVIAVSVVAYIAMFVFLIWASIKLALVPAAVAVVPSGTSALRSAWNATSGYFWPVFGRLFLLGLILGLVYMVPYFVGIFLLPALLFSQVDILPNGELAIDGQAIDTLDLFAFSEFLPNPVLVVAVFGIMMFLMGMIRTVSYSGSSALYADLEGPNSFGYARR